MGIPTIWQQPSMAASGLVPFRLAILGFVMFAASVGNAYAQSTILSTRTVHAADAVKATRIGADMIGAPVWKSPFSYCQYQEDTRAAADGTADADAKRRLQSASGWAILRHMLSGGTKVYVIRISQVLCHGSYVDNPDWGAPVERTLAEVKVNDPRSHYSGQTVWIPTDNVNSH
jgi:hypothetical protein